ncbi:manganese/iron transport system substrate-binding protein [Synechococcus elongatus PCC 6311]|uniref:Mn transporter MntC n=2 Tax=Synechococcus elongatus TaxID=32046 RepID=Q31K14_SYNE7|nr:zinc ABC transporter substrate-binding protein [Synechococcus elongatus]AJD56942.1 Mn transporter MntC [Synechococcus elongatus UTEX 2973]MBD2587325.1 zinc ABC transporter substrate-binding protein [Synechococcus elongatus FACHB-242]UOW72403.1 manganese/iron transport system substrate-binding protein [Synechococcus elongatus PCC 7943]UOW75124.1 manganese/iron transport system substrate-binding protein [Synechococcus elongatus PCC 6311]UOW77844.1 manganese/iron transport system substrate-bin
MPRSASWFALLVVSVSLVACRTLRSNTPSAESGSSEPLKVVVSTTILTDLTQRIGGDAITVTGLLQPGDDPHVYEPVPRDTVTLAKANLIILNGYNLEPKIEKLVTGVDSSAAILRAGEAIAPLKLGKAPDPHVWGSARNGMQMAQSIQRKLCELQPQSCPQFQANTQMLLQDLTQLDQWIRQQITTIPNSQRQLVTTHDAFQYYSQAYQLPVLGTLIGISTEEQPSARTVQTLANAIRETGVPVIFTETTTNSSLLATVAMEASVRLSRQPLYADAIGPAGSRADSYIKMLATNTQIIVEELGGIVTPFPNN